MKAIKLPTTSALRLTISGFNGGAAMHFGGFEQTYLVWKQLDEQGVTRGASLLCKTRFQVSVARLIHQVANQKGKHNTGQQEKSWTQYTAMRTGELARRAGVNVETLRFYERRKLLRPPARTAGGYRDYTEQDLETVCFIKQCQHLGFTLKEIVQLAELHRVFPKAIASGKAKSAEVTKFRRMSEERLRVIDEKIAALRMIRAKLWRLAQELLKTKGLVCPAGKR